MSLRDQLQADFDAIQAGDDLAETVTYVAQGDAPAEIPMNIFRGPRAPAVFDRGAHVEWKLCGWVSRTNVPTPRVNSDTITCKKHEQSQDEETFTLRAILAENAASFLIAIG